MTIAQRLTALIATALTGLILLAGVNYVQSDKVFKAANYANENTVPSLEAINKTISAFLQIRIRVMYHLVALDPALKATTEKTLKEEVAAVDKSIKNYEALITDDEDRRFVEAQKAAFGDYRITSYNVCYTKLLRLVSGLRRLLRQLHVQPKDLTQSYMTKEREPRLPFFYAGDVTTLLLSWCGVVLVVHDRNLDLDRVYVDRWPLVDAEGNHLREGDDQADH